MPLKLAEEQEQANAAATAIFAFGGQQNQPFVVLVAIDSCPRRHPDAGDTGTDPTLSSLWSHDFWDDEKAAQALMGHGLVAAGVVVPASVVCNLFLSKQGGDTRATCAGRHWIEVYTSPKPRVCKVGCQCDDVGVRCRERKIRSAPGCATWIEV